MTTGADSLYRVSIVGLPASAIVGVTTPYLLGMLNLSILGLYFAVPMLLAPVVAWRFRTRADRRSLRPGTIDWRIPSVLFHTTVSVLVLMVVFYEVRPLSFFVGLAVAYALVFALLAGTNATRLSSVIGLYHVVVALLVTVFSVTLKYDFFVGRTDLSTHIPMVTQIIEAGRIPAQFEAYASFPLWQVYAAVTYQLFGGWVTPHATMYLLSGLLFGAGVTVMYALAMRVYPDRNVALLACLLTITYPLYIFYGMYSIPRSATSILFLVLLLTLVSQSSPRMRALSLFFVLALVIYHPVTTPFVAVILALLYLVERALRRPTPIVDSVTLSFVALLTLVYWLYSAEYLVDRITGTILATVFGPAGESTTPAGVVTSPWAELANYVPYAFVVGFVLLGFLFWFRDEDRHGSSFAAIALVTICLIPLSLPGPMLLLDSLAGVNVDRFGHYTFMFFSLTGAVGLHRLLKLGGKRLFVVLLVVMALFAGGAVSNDFVASDNPVVERPFYTYYLTDHERQSFAHVDAVNDGEIGSDRISCRYLAGIHSAECWLPDVAEGEDMFDEYDGVLIRDGEREKRPLQFSEYVDSADIPWGELEERNRVYDSGTVSYYR